MTATRSSQKAEPARAGYGLLAWFLFVSGVLALVYEIIWQRQFAVVFGSASPATAAVLAAYFAGLGLGAWVVGRFAGRWQRPLRAYAVLEALIGVGALLVSPLLRLFEGAYPWLFGAFASEPGAFTAVRVLAAFLIIGLPTFCMGGTLPLLGEMVDQGRRQLGQTVGWLYVVNTVGAGAGALLVPFVAMPALGLTKTVWLAAALNGVLAIAAWSWDRKLAVPTAANARTDAPERSRTSSPMSSETLPPVVVPALISGVVTFALQVLWNRAFAQVHENSMYSFAVIVAVVIFALALGAQLARFALRWGIKPTRLVGGAWLLGGLTVVVGPWMFLKATDGLSYLPADGDWSSHAWQLVRLALTLIFVPMALLGIGLPAIMEQAGRLGSEGAGRVLGRLLAANVLGSVIGALAAGFLLPSALGLWAAMIWLGVLLMLAGVWQMRTRSQSRAGGWVSGVCAAAWLVSVVPLRDLELPRVRFAAKEGEQLIALAEGTHGITSVLERDGKRRLKLNNHYGLGGTAATADERMQAHVPLLLHPAPARVAFLGLGTGITASGALFHPVQHITAIELVPEVVEAARTQFTEANANLFEDSRTRVVTDDARNFLRGSNERFDVIVGDLVVPWRQGEGALFTLEQFTAARDALAPGGHFCQWLPLFQLSEVEVTILIRTFLSVFPRAQVWRGDFWPNEPAIALIGSVEPLRIDHPTVHRRLAELKRDPTNPHLDAASIIWMHWIGLLEVADLPANELRLNREDQPWIELLGPLLHAGSEKDQLFTGRKLQAWLKTLRQRSETRVSPLTPDQVAGLNAGEHLAEMVLCLAEGDRAGAEAAQQRLRSILPPDSLRRMMVR
jgi:spermidine synthase